MLGKLDLAGNGIGVDGALALGKVLRARSLPSSGFTLEGVSLRVLWEALELPVAGRRWSNEKVLAHFVELFARRAMVFAMVAHVRLGQESRWSGLDPNLISMIWSLVRKAELVGCVDTSEEGGVAGKGRGAEGTKRSTHTHTHRHMRFIR